MSDDRREAPPSGSSTPQDVAEQTKHRQSQIFERENRPERRSPSGFESAEKRLQTGQDMAAAGEQSIGEAAGADTSGAVAHPAEMNRPGGSAKLGGTPGATAMPSGGRGSGY